jgi:hypothetical protein
MYHRACSVSPAAVGIVAVGHVQRNGDQAGNVGAGAQRGGEQVEVVVQE